MTVDEQLIEAANNGDVATLERLLDLHPEKLGLSTPPYGGTLLHAAATHLPAVEFLLGRGLDPNAREGGDNTYPMHWAAAAGRLEVVRRLADAGGDVVGRGDDHELEVIGWATCWDGCDDEAHRAVVDFLVGRGARHHIFSAIAMDLADEVRRIVAADAAALNRRMSRNENHQMPLHFAVRMQRPAMVALLVELGADPLGVDGAGQPVATYAEQPDIDRPVMAAVHAMTKAELTSAERGQRPPRGTSMDLMAALALADWETAERLLRESPELNASGAPPPGPLHLMAKRNDAAAVTWLLDHGADPNARWAHWDADVAPLHLAVLGGHDAIVRLLLDRGANPRIKDTRHDADATGWAEFFQRDDIVSIIRDHL